MSGDGEALREAGRPRLLVVDDDGVIREMLRAALGSRYEVVCQPHGDGIVDDLADPRLRLLVMDVTLPGAEGRAMLSAARSAALRRGLPVLFMSVRNDDAGFLRWLRSEGGSLIMKPFEIAPFRAEVERLIAARPI